MSYVIVDVTELTNNFNPNAVYARKPYMLVKLCVPAACCFAVTFSALSLTYMHAVEAVQGSQHRLVSYHA
jgi:hypothetical protein